MVHKDMVGHEINNSENKTVQLQNVQGNVHGDFGTAHKTWEIWCSTDGGLPFSLAVLQF